MLRGATPADAAALARVRATSFGAQQPLPGLTAAMESVLGEHVDAGDFCAYLIEEDGAIVAYGIGMIHQRLPSDHNPSGRWGYVQSMETRSDRRGRATAASS